MDILKELHDFTMQKAKDAFLEVGVRSDTSFINSSVDSNFHEGLLIAYKDVLQKIKDMGYKEEHDLSDPSKKP